MADIADIWDAYYADAQRDTALQDEQLFRLELDAILAELGRAVAETRKISVLELGSGTGFLAAAIAARFEVDYVGVDISATACSRARERGLRGCIFEATDFLSFLERDDRTYDVVVTQRSVMALLERSAQQQLLRLVRERIDRHGVALLSEATEEGARRVDELRHQLGIAPLERIWHSRPVELADVEAVFGSVEVHDFASLYWLVTRVLYPYFAEPVHNTPLHVFAAALEQHGDFGYVKLLVARP